jgi:branched-chain amino acid transport system substrate-binding protein
MRYCAIAVVLSVFLGIGILAGTCSAADNQPYKVGLVMELTGGMAAGGKECRDGVVLEVEHFNAAGGINGRRLELVSGDTGSDATKAVTAATKLTRQDKVLVLFGPLYNTLEGPVRAIAERDKTPNLILSTPTPDDRTRHYKWSWTLAQNEIVVAEAQLDILKLKGWKKAIAIGDTQASWQEQIRILKAKAAADGIKIIAMSETFDPAQDFELSAQVTKVKDLAAKEKPDALVLMTNIFSAIPFGKSMKQLGLSLPVIGTHAFGVLPGLAMAGDEVNGWLFPAGKVLAAEALPDNDPQKPVITEYRKRFREKFNYDVGQFGAHSYDAVHLWVNAVNAAGTTDKAKVRDAMDKTTNYVGITGIYNFTPKDHEGLKKNSLAIYEIKDKKFVFLKTVK